MKTLRTLAVSFLLVLSVLFGASVPLRAEEAPEPPDSGCAWAYGANLGGGVWTGVYSCGSCYYNYEYRNGHWSQTGGPRCDGKGDNPPEV